MNEEETDKGTEGSPHGTGGNPQASDHPGATRPGSGSARPVPGRPGGGLAAARLPGMPGAVPRTTPRPSAAAQGRPPAAPNVDNGAAPQRRLDGPRNQGSANVDKPNERPRNQGSANVDKYGDDPWSGGFANVDNPGPLTSLPRAPQVKGMRGPDPAVLEMIRRQAKDRFQRQIEPEAPGQGASPSRVSPHPAARRNTTVSPSTLEQYLNKGRQLLARYRRERGMLDEGDSFDPVSFVTWALSIKPEVTAGSWRLYRQGVIHLVQGVPDANMERALAILDNDTIEPTPAEARPVRLPEIIDGEGGLAEIAAEASDDEDEDEDDEGGGRKRAKQTSALKEKKFPREDFAKVVSFLRFHTRAKIAPDLITWLVAGVATGLRPIEWRATYLETHEDPSSPTGRRSWLYVLNAKATNGRGTGVVRTLDLSEIPDTVFMHIERMSRLGREWYLSGDFTTRKSRCSKLLEGVVARSTPGKHYTLYSCRHQAIANWKATMPIEEVAALAGHGVTKTQASHYGKRRSAWKPQEIGPTPRPVPEEVALVRQSIISFAERNAKGLAAGLKKAKEEFPV